MCGMGVRWWFESSHVDPHVITDGNEIALGSQWCLRSLKSARDYRR